jgi:hypothetical protein
MLPLKGGVCGLKALHNSNNDWLEIRDGKWIQITGGPRKCLDGERGKGKRLRDKT